MVLKIRIKIFWENSTEYCEAASKKKWIFGDVNQSVNLQDDVGGPAEDPESHDRAARGAGGGGRRHQVRPFRFNILADSDLADPGLFEFLETDLGVLFKQLFSFKKMDISNIWSLFLYFYIFVIILFLLKFISFKMVMKFKMIWHIFFSSKDTGICLLRFSYFFFERCAIDRNGLIELKPLKHIHWWDTLHLTFCSFFRTPDLPSNVYLKESLCLLSVFFLFFMNTSLV
jgi:hypothetical protein